MLSQYSPKHFGKEYFEIKGSSQYSMFVATSLGIKPCFDDWIPLKDYSRFVGVCGKYGLHVEPDIVFTKPPEDKKGIVGGQNITTTNFIGERFGLANEGDVHVVISRSPELARDAKRFGWYSAAINNRSINKPFVDHLRFGRLLGFPKCCVEFFARYNNWNLYSHPFETLKNTKRDGKAIGSYHCNNILMDSTYFFIHHLPCSYRCRNTIEYAKKVEAGIQAKEPEFVAATVQLLKMPLLILGEKHFVLFDGNLDAGKLEYKRFQYHPNEARPEECIGFMDSIQKGNCLTLEGDMLRIWSGTSLIEETNMREEWFLACFD